MEKVLLWVLLAISATSMIFLLTKSVSYSLSGATTATLSGVCSDAVKTATGICKSQGHSSVACRDAATTAASVCGFSTVPTTKDCEDAVAEAEIACANPKQNPDGCRDAVEDVAIACGPLK